MTKQIDQRIDQAERVTHQQSNLYGPGSFDGRLLSVGQLQRLINLMKSAATLNAADQIELAMLRRVSTVGDGTDYVPAKLTADEERAFLEQAEAAGNVDVVREHISEWRSFWSDRWA